MTSTRWAGIAATAIVTLLCVTPQQTHAASSRSCLRLAKSFEKARGARPLDAARKLRTLHDRDPECFEAPDAAFALLERVWSQVTPTAERAMSAEAVERHWARYKNWASFAQAMTAFRLATTRPRATLALGKIHEGFAAFLDQVGNNPGQLVVIRDVPESLYHSRAVDLSEYLKIQAETAYDLVARLLVNASRTNETLVEAERRAAGLRSRYRERVEAQRAQEAARAAREAESGELEDDE